MKTVVAAALCVLSLSPTDLFGQHAKKEPISGAGNSAMVVSLFVEEFNKTAGGMGYLFAVPPESSKHAGGVANAERFLFGRTGRPLNDKEKESGKEEIPLARIPITFAVGSAVGISSLNQAQLEEIYTGRIRNWKQVGGADHAIDLLGRESSEALFTELKKTYPFFAKAVFQNVLSNDTQLINLLKSRVGDHSLGFGSEIEFSASGLNIVSVAGFSAGVNVGLVYDVKNKSNPVVKAAIDYARSKEWSGVLTSKTNAQLPR